MFIVDFFGWWYGLSWRHILEISSRQIDHLAASFSVGLLLRTLFSPWRRIISSPGNGLGAHFRAMMDNLIGRCIGFLVRLFVLLIAGISFLLLALLIVIEIVVWPVLPIGSVALIIWGLA